MGEYLFYDYRVFNAVNHFNAAAEATDFDVEIEDPLEVPTFGALGMSGLRNARRYMYVRFCWI